MTVGVYSPHLSPSCLPKASIHDFWRRTMVFQQGVDTRASAGMTVVVHSPHLSPSCLPKASIHGFGDARW
jgi:hypothetical protein